MRRIVPVLGLLTAAALASSCAVTASRQARIPERTAPYDHSGEIAAYEGAKTCAGCHEDSAREVVESLHWQQAGPAPFVVGQPEGFQPGMMTSF